MYIDPNPYSPEIVLAFPFWCVVVSIFGACVGSFLNVCIWRIPRNESVVNPPSSCPNCGHQLGWYENFPVVGWLVLRGKCKSCRQPISIQYLLMELLVALMFFAVWFKVYVNHEYLTALIPYFIITSLVITTFFIDLKHHIIPNVTLYPAMCAGLTCAALLPELWAATTWWQALAQSVASMLLGGGAVGLLKLVGHRLFKCEIISCGGVGYIAAISAVLGIKCAVFSFLIGGAAAIIVVAGLKILNSRKHGATPFGSYMSVATYIWILGDVYITQWSSALIL